VNCALPSNPPRTALVVDDDDFVRSAIAQMLCRLGIAEVRTADSGEHACESLQRDGPAELIVCDLMMPGGDGIEMMSRVVQLSPQGHVVLVSSAEAKLLRSAHELAQEQGVQLLGVLSKPVRQAELGALLGHLPLPRSVPAAAPTAAVETLEAVQLRAALQAREFHIEVQPQLCLRTLHVVGTEALVRWHSPRWGALSPEQFLPALTRAGLMGPLTDQILRQSIEALGAWRRQGHDLRIAINICPETAGDRGLPARIGALAAEIGVEPSRIVIEVTESGLMQESFQPLEVLTRLRLHGMELSIDDFGTGYSTLERLQRFAFTELKIDRRFVAAAASDAEARGIVESNVGLARSLGLRTVAEGIETAADLRLMIELGCDSAQGYYIARPMPPALLPAWLHSQRMLSCLHQHPACPVAHDCVLACRLGPKR